MTNDEMVKRAIADADRILDAEVIIPEIIKTAASYGVPAPRTQSDYDGMFTTINLLQRAKQAVDDGSFPALRQQLNDNNEFQLVANMAKKAYSNLVEKFAQPTPSDELKAVMSKLATAVEKVEKARTPAQPAAAAAK